MHRPLVDYDEQRILGSIDSSPKVIGIRERITKAKSELDQAYTALGQMPEHMKDQLLEAEKQRLTDLEEREAEVVESVRRSAQAVQVQERLNSIRIEVQPKLERASKCFDYAREALTHLLRLENEARALGGSVMSERLDRSAIAFFVPTLTLEERGTWTLKR